MVHRKALAIVVAYDMYLECTEGQLDASWRIKKPVDFFRFREKLGKQMLTYSPKLCKYTQVISCFEKQHKHQSVIGTRDTAEVHQGAAAHPHQVVVFLLKLC